MTGKIKKIISIENGDNYVADIEDIENRITQNSSNLESAKTELSNKCNEALNEAKAYTDQEKANLVKKSGDVLTGVEFTRNVDNSSLKLYGGTSWGRSASISLTGNKADTPCAVDLFCHNPTSEITGDFNCLHLQYKKIPTWNDNPIEIVNSIGPNYIRYDSGVQICWGNTPGKDNSTPDNYDSIEINLSKAFKNTDYKVICTDTGAACYVFGVQVSNTTRFTVYVQHWDGVGFWGASYIAIGMWK